MSQLDAITIVNRMIEEAIDWRRQHLRFGRRIEAAGAEIRIKALQDVREELLKGATT